MMNMMTAWMAQKFPELANMTTAQKIAFMKQSGMIGQSANQYQKMGLDFGMSGYRDVTRENPAMGPQGLMGLAQNAGNMAPRQRRQVEITFPGLMGQTQFNPWENGLWG